jgi:hypothetical protein
MVATKALKTRGDYLKIVYIVHISVLYKMINFA